MRARVKKFEDMPEHSRHCKQSEEQNKKICGREIEIDPHPVEYTIFYNCCGLEHKTQVFFLNESLRDILDGRFIPVDAVDIDEGQVN